ncbi:hypothetical protein N9891_00290 [bacterium]|nr:hypothetical protein [bacterium]
MTLISRHSRCSQGHSARGYKGADLAAIGMAKILFFALFLGSVIFATTGLARISRALFLK